MISPRTPKSAEHAFERGRIGLDHVGAQGGAVGRARRRQEIERRQRVAAVRAARRRGAGLLLRTGAGASSSVLLDLLFVGIEVGRRLARAAPSKRGSARRSAAAARGVIGTTPRAALHQPARDPPFEAEQAVRRSSRARRKPAAHGRRSRPRSPPPSRLRRPPRRAVRIRLPPPAPQMPPAPASAATATCAQAPDAARPAASATARRRRVADDAAESGRQRPVHGCAAGRRRTPRPGARRTIQIRPRSHSRRSGRWLASRQPQSAIGSTHGDGAEPEQLHHQIGHDRARLADQIVHRAVGGVAEARVLHRPGCQREPRAAARSATSASADELAQRGA